jgi:hypothetical protein
MINMRDLMDVRESFLKRTPLEEESEPNRMGGLMLMMAAMGDQKEPSSEATSHRR